MYHEQALNETTEEIVAGLGPMISRLRKDCEAVEAELYRAYEKIVGPMPQSPENAANVAGPSSLQRSLKDVSKKVDNVRRLAVSINNNL